jgi:hypothetical protein
MKNMEPRGPDHLTPEIRALLESSGRFELNDDYHLRDRLLGIDADWADSSRPGSVGFDLLDLHTFTKLLLKRFIDPGQRCRRSPTVGEIYRFMAKYPGVRACGFAVSPFCEECSITIDGLFVAPDDVSESLRQAFIAFCLFAGSLCTEPMLEAAWI